MLGTRVSFALAILVAALILACSVAVSGYWLARHQRSAAAADQQQRLTATALLLSETAQQMIEAGDLASLRDLIADAAQWHGLSRCRVELDNGDILADRDPSLVTVERVNAASWNGAANRRQTVIHHGNELEITVPLTVSGRGGATLQIESRLDTASNGWGGMAGVAAIGGCGLLLLGVCGYVFHRIFGAMGVIRESLLAAAGGENATGALSVSGRLGPEARAWNDLLEDYERLQMQCEVKRVRESLGGGDSGELTIGCDAMSHGVLLLDGLLSVRYANPAAAVYLRADPAQLVGARFERCINDEQLHAKLSSCVTHGSQRRITHEVDLAEQGGKGVLRFSIHPARRDGSAGSTSSGGAAIMVVIEDVTQLRVAEKARNDFVTQATHELRTPLTNIRLYVESAIEDGDSDPTMREKALTVINQETARLERMVSNLLSVAEIEAGSLQLQRDDVRLNEVFRDLEDDFSPQAREKRIALAFNLPPKLDVIQADREKLCSAIHNLVGNALKYTPADGRVTVNVEMDARSLIVEVADSGIGIAPDDLEHVFDKFYRAKDRRLTGVTGSGLGLALAREIARLHGGDITVESQLDRGTAFRMTIPLSEMKEAA